MTLLESVRARLEPMEDILFALVFGSVSRGEQRTDSDLDVAVYANDGLNVRQRFELRLRATTELEGLGRPDVILLNDAPSLLAHRALQGAPVLMRDKRAYVRFFVRTIAASEDERHFRAIFARARQARVSEGRFGRP